METDHKHAWHDFISGSVFRGPAELITDDFARRLGYVFAQHIAQRMNTTSDQLKIAVGRDSRASGARLSAAIIQGLTAADCDVFDCGLCTTPAMYLTAIAPQTLAHGAIMITGGRHAAADNGFKFIVRDESFQPEDMRALIDAAIRAEVPQRLVTKVDFLSIYADYLKQLVHKLLEDDALKPLLGLRVVVDAGNGAGCFYASLLEDLGVDVDGSLNLAPSGYFGRDPDPDNAEAVRAVSEAVVAKTADLGVLFDPDGNRAVIIDHTGEVIQRDRLIALIAAILLNEQTGATFVTDSVTSSGLAQFITEWGGEHYRYKRGYRSVIDEANRLQDEGIDVRLAIETTGHAAFRENHFIDDGLYLVTRLICEALNRKREGLTLCSLIDELQEPVESVELRLPITGDDPHETAREIIECILSHTLDNPEWTLAADNREGVRITFNLDNGISNAWFLMRLSVNDPVMPLNAQSDVPGGVKHMLSQLYALLSNLEDSGLDLTRLKDAL